MATEVAEVAGVAGIGDGTDFAEITRGDIGSADEAAGVVGEFVEVSEILEAAEIAEVAEGAKVKGLAEIEAAAEDGRRGRADSYCGGVRRGVGSLLLGLARGESTPGGRNEVAGDAEVDCVGVFEAGIDRACDEVCNDGDGDGDGVKDGGREVFCLVEESGVRSVRGGRPSLRGALNRRR